MSCDHYARGISGCTSCDPAYAGWRAGQEAQRRAAVAPAKRFAAPQAPTPLPQVTARLRAANDALEASLAPRRPTAPPPAADTFRNATRIAKGEKKP